MALPKQILINHSRDRTVIFTFFLTFQNYSCIKRPSKSKHPKNMKEKRVLQRYVQKLQIVVIFIAIIVFVSAF